MIYTEDSLKKWGTPLSQTEEQRVENAVRMIKETVTTYVKLANCKIEVFTQGSYANNTNVRQNSDVDICVMLTSTFFCSYVNGKSDIDYGYTVGTISYAEYKAYIIEALKDKFGDNAVTVGNKSINIESNSYHINTDVVPAFQYRDFKTIISSDPSIYIEGIKYLSKDGTKVINYPKEHISNGKKKNNNTNYKYKKLVRIMKHISYTMVDNSLADKDKITSFLIESLVWNVPNEIITGSTTWTGTIKNAIAYLWNAINDEAHKEWREVSERLYLFYPGRKWTAIETKDFLYAMYNYLEIE